MARIRAAVCRAFGAPLTVEEVDLAPPGPGQVMVRMEACAICHSDISYAEGAWGGPLPTVYGHEGVGRIEALGAGVTRYAAGDRVLVTLMLSCGACAPCATGRPAYCAEKYTARPSPLSLPDGTPLGHGLSTAGFAEATVVDQSQVAAIPETIPAEAACLLSCGVTTGLGASVNTARIRPGETVVVIGAGGVGLNAIQGARLAGAARVVAVDMMQGKLEAAKGFGATDGILASDPKPWARLAEIAPRMADVVLVSVGAIPAYETAPRYLAPQGRMVMVGMPHSGQTAAYEPVILAALGQGMQGTMMGDTVLTRDIPWMVDLYGQGRLKLDELVSGRWTLDQINAAIADTNSGAALRNVILF